MVYIAGSHQIEDAHRIVVRYLYDNKFYSNISSPNSSSKQSTLDPRCCALVYL